MTMFGKNNSPGAADYIRPNYGPDIPDPEDAAFKVQETPFIVKFNKGVLRAAMDGSDKKTAKDIAKRYIEACFTSQFGGWLATFQNEASFLQQRLNVEDAEQERLDAALAREPVEIEAHKLNGGVDTPDLEMDVPIKRWNLKEKVTGLTSIVGMVLLAIAAYFGTQATFQSAQLPIFDEFWYLSYMLAALVPIAGWSIKSIGNAFQDLRNRDLYRKIINILSGISFLVWIILFSLLFEGTSGTFDPFAEPNHLVGWGFNFSQIISEVLISASLFGQLESIFNRFAISRKVPNPAIHALEAAKEKQLSLVAFLNARLAAIEGAISVLQGVRDEAHTYIEAAIGQSMNEVPRVTLI